MSVVLCVTLWAVPDRELQLAEYEDAVLALLPEHGARLVARVRTAEPRVDAAYETQIIELPSDGALDAYMADPRRMAMTATRDAVIARTEIQRVDLV